MYVNIEDLCFEYEKKKKVLDAISLSMKEGEIIAILGSSGSGKSTLLRLLSGLEMPKKGAITINQEVLCSKEKFVDASKREVGLVFQDYALFPHMNVYKNIAYGLTHLKKEAKHKQVMKMLELVDMKEKAHAFPHELSGGQQQRVALARALAISPKILLLDEPFSNLDTTLKSKIREELKEIIRKTKMTSILVTHDYEDASAISDRIIYLESGKIIKEEQLA